MKIKSEKSIRTQLISAFILLDLLFFAVVSAIGYPMVLNHEKELQAVAESSALPSLLWQFTLILVISFILVAGISVIIALCLDKKISAPINEILKVTESYRDGNFDAKADVENAPSEIRRLSENLWETANALQKSEENRRTFIGSVSHDMRSPMTSIAGFVDSILDGTVPKEKEKHYLKIVSSETHRLSRLVSSMLDITRIQSGERKLNMTEFDICELLRLSLISLESQIEEKQLEIEFEAVRDKCTVLADRDAIHQVVYNLLHNAVKFTERGGKLKLCTQDYDDGKLLITVYNTGAGIKSEELPDIFDKFYRASSSRTDKSGTGLGLYIVKTIVTAHGEKIWAESEEGKYCAMKFTLSGVQSQKNS